MITTLYCYTFCASRICLEPASVSPHEWPDDITKWPVSMLKRRLVLRPKQKKDRSDCDFSQESSGFESRARPSCVRLHVVPVFVPVFSRSWYPQHCRSTTHCSTTKDRLNALKEFFKSHIIATTGKSWHPSNIYVIPQNTEILDHLQFSNVIIFLPATFILFSV